MAVTPSSWDLDRGTKFIQLSFVEGSWDYRKFFRNTYNTLANQRPIKAKVENDESYVQAVVTLHNYFNQTESLTAMQNECSDRENVESHDRGLIP